MLCCKHNSLVLYIHEECLFGTQHLSENIPVSLSEYTHQCPSDWLHTCMTTWMWLSVSFCLSTHLYHCLNVCITVPLSVHTPYDYKNAHITVHLSVHTPNHYPNVHASVFICLQSTYVWTYVTNCWFSFERIWRIRNSGKNRWWNNLRNLFDYD